MSPTINGRIDPATGVFTSRTQHGAEATDRKSRPVDPEVAAHEARHAAIALMHGVPVTEARADYPSADAAGHVLFAADTHPRDKALISLAGEMGQPGWPPDWPSRAGNAACDEYRLAEEVDELDLDRRGYDALCAEAKNLVDSLGIADLASMIELFLAKGCVLRESHLATFYNTICPPRSGVLAKFETATLQRKSFTASNQRQRQRRVHRSGCGLQQHRQGRRPDHARRVHQDAR